MTEHFWNGYLWMGVGTGAIWVLFLTVLAFIDSDGDEGALVGVLLSPFFIFLWPICWLVLIGGLILHALKAES